MKLVCDECGRDCELDIPEDAAPKCWIQCGNCSGNHRGDWMMCRNPDCHNSQKCWSPTNCGACGELDFVWDRPIGKPQ